VTADMTLVADALGASQIRRPVEIVHRPHHSYKKGPKGSRGCLAVLENGVACREAKSNPVHHLPTMNETLTQGWQVYQGALKHWKPWLIGALEASGLPRGLESVLVEGMCCFPTKAHPDQGNHRAFIEKAMGDALQDGGWIPEDTWERYEFGNLAYRYEKGVRWTRLRVFPDGLAPRG
jgi:hypothetical protein